MFKIAFIGAGSSIFAKNVLGDCIINPKLGEFEIALYDIDLERLDESYRMLVKLNLEYSGKATVVKYTDRRECLRNAKYIVNAMQVGGYKPCTVWDFEIPRKYGLEQTIGDTLGVAGVFRGLRTIKVLEEMAEEIHEVCPNAIFLNYGNPMAILSGYMNKYLGINTVGLCHSVQWCSKGLLQTFKMDEYIGHTKEVIYGINHQAWLLSLTDEKGNDLYPEIKRRNELPDPEGKKNWDLVRLEMMRTFGYYVTESSEHTSEYTPWFIHKAKPEIVKKYNVPIDEYLRRCEKNIKDWNDIKETVLGGTELKHEKSIEFACAIIEACETNVPTVIHGNVLNKDGLIPNLPLEACVEVPCVIDAEGIHPQKMPPLPEVCAAINRTNINVQILAMEGAKKRDMNLIIQACCLDPHTAAELSIDEIKSLVKELYETEKEYLPELH